MSFPTGPFSRLRSAVDAPSLAQSIHRDVSQLEAQKPDGRGKHAEIDQGDEPDARHRELEGPLAMAQVQQIRIPFGVVGVLMVGHVEDAVEMDRREDWKHAEEVGNEIIKEAMLHERVMRGFMAQAGQAMLERADLRDRYQENGEV